MQLATLIHNRGAGSARDAELERAQALLAPHFELDVRIATAELTPSLLAQQAVHEGAELLIASGGDGTVSSVAAALIGKLDRTLAILPRGTANSIAAQLGVPADLEQACAVITGGQSRIIDTASVNGQAMLLFASIGVHAQAITEADPERKRLYGPIAYVFEEVEHMLRDELFEITLESNGQTATCSANAVTVANLARAATLLAQGAGSVVEDDGLLDVTIVAIRGLAEALATSFHLATRAITQTPSERDNVGFFRTTEIRISTREPRRVMIDGEDATETPIVVVAVPKSLRVAVPGE